MFLPSQSKAMSHVAFCFSVTALFAVLETATVLYLATPMLRYTLRWTAADAASHPSQSNSVNIARRTPRIAASSRRPRDNHTESDWPRRPIASSAVHQEVKRSVAMEPPKQVTQRLRSGFSVCPPRERTFALRGGCCRFNSEEDTDLVSPHSFCLPLAMPK